MKTFTAKSSAVRAAAKALGVARKMSEVEKVAIITKNEDGLWTWVAIEKVSTDVDALLDQAEKVKEQMEDTGLIVDTEKAEKKVAVEYCAPNITDLEAQMIFDISRSEYAEFNGADPDTAEQTSTYAFDVVKTNEDKGVIASLIKKELVYHDDFSDMKGYEDQDSLVRLSDLGFLVYKQYDFAALRQRQADAEKQEPVAEKVAPKKAASGKTWNRPGEGTLTGRVWELADIMPSRKAVMTQAAIEGLNLNMVSQQYYRWTHRS